MLRIGDYVKIKETKLFGNIVRINKNKYTVNINEKLLTISKEKLEKVNNYDIHKNNISNVTYDIKKEKNFENEIMLRHKTKEIAIYELDKFIDSAIIHNAGFVRIIHGKNGGILRDAVHEYLKNNKNIERFELAGYFDGQFGVTIAYLK